MNFEYMALGRMLRGGRLKQERSRPKQEVTQPEIDELTESWINGNRTFVVGEIANMRPIEAALAAARIFEATKDPSFMRLLEARQ